MLQFQQSEATAARRRVPIHLVDATDGITPETGEAAGQPQISKNGGAFANTSATLTAIANGAYYVELTAAELDTLGFGVVRYKSAATAEAQVAFQIIGYDINAEVVGGRMIKTTVATVTSQFVMTLTDGAADDGAYGRCTVLFTDQTTGAQKSISSISSYTGATKTINLLSVATFTVAVGDTIEIFIPSHRADVNIDTVDTNVDAILVDTGTTLNDKIDTIDTNVDAILVDTGTTLPADIATVDANVDAILVDTSTTLETHLTDIKGATFSGATDSLEAIRNRGDAAWTTGAGGSSPNLLQNTTIATLASQTSFTLTAGSSDDDAYNNCILIVTDQSTAEQKFVADVSDYTGSTKTITLAATPASTFTIATGDTVDIIAADVGARVDLGSIEGKVDTVDTNVDAVLVDTGTTLPGLLTTIDTVVDAILADTGTDGVVLSASQMNAIADHVWRRTYANVEASSDGDTEAFRSGLGVMAKLVNRVAASGGTLTIYKDDDTTALGTQALTTDAAADPITEVNTN